MMAHNYFDVYCRPPKPDTRWETSTNMGSVGRLVDHVKFVVFLKKGILCRIRLTVATPKHPALAFFSIPLSDFPTNPLATLTPVLSHAKVQLGGRSNAIYKRQMRDGMKPLGFVSFCPFPLPLL
jgi:hypothetical protein